jgi:hypothetical protein
MRITRNALLLAGGFTLATGSGFLAAEALGVGAQAPTATTTVNVGQGAAGPTGPSGPAGPAGPTGPAGSGGAENCPTGSTFKAVLLNAPGGQTEIWTCVKN